MALHILLAARVYPSYLLISFKRVVLKTCFTKWWQDYFRSNQYNGLQFSLISYALEATIETEILCASQRCLHNTSYQGFVVYASVLEFRQMFHLKY